MFKAEVVVVADVVIWELHTYNSGGQILGQMLITYESNIFGPRKEIILVTWVVTLTEWDKDNDSWVVNVKVQRNDGYRVEPVRYKWKGVWIHR